MPAEGNGHCACGVLVFLSVRYRLSLKVTHLSSEIAQGALMPSYGVSTLSFQQRQTFVWKIVLVAISETSFDSSRLRYGTEAQTCLFNWQTFTLLVYWNSSFVEDCGLSGKSTWQVSKKVMHSSGQKLAFCQDNLGRCHRITCR